MTDGTIKANKITLFSFLSHVRWALQILFSKNKVIEKPKSQPPTKKTVNLIVVTPYIRTMGPLRESIDGKTNM